MRRRLSALSILLCLLSAALWVRSYFAADAFWFDKGGRDERLLVCRSTQGRMWMAAGALWSAEIRERGWYATSSDPEPLVIGNDDQVLFQWTGLGGGRVRSAVFDSYELAFPLWLPVLLAAILPTMRFVRHQRRRRRLRQGLCHACGYDLRGLTSARCPECGTAMTPVAPRS